MIPNTQEFPVEAQCIHCGTYGIHWVNFVEYHFSYRSVRCTCECDNCSEAYEVMIQDTDYEALQPEEMKTLNLN